MLGLLDELVGLLLLFRKAVPVSGQLALLRIQVPEALVQLGRLLIKLVLLVLDNILAIFQLTVTLVHLTVVIAFKLEEVLLSLEHLRLLDIFCFYSSLFYYGIRTALIHRARNCDINTQCKSSTCNGGNDVIQKHN